MKNKIQLGDLVKAYGNTYRVDGFGITNDTLHVTQRKDCQWVGFTTLNANNVTEVRDSKGRNK